MRALIVAYLCLAVGLFAYAMAGDWLRVERHNKMEPDRSARFELYSGAGGEHWWRLKGPDNQVIASGEGYADKEAAKSVIQKVQEYAANAQIEEIDAN